MPIKKLPTLFLLGLLAACTTTSAESAGDTRRIIVSFEGALPFDAPALLDRFSAAAGGKVEFIGAVSPGAAAYLVHCPARASCAQAIAQIRRQDGVTDVQADQRATGAGVLRK